MKYLLTALVFVAALGAGAVIWVRSEVSGEHGDIPLPQRELQQTLDITAFGTSLTANYGWPQALQAALADCLGTPVKVSVVAQPGGGTAWAEDQIGAVMETEPDVILMEFAINDADVLDGRWAGTSHAAHAALLEALQVEGTPPAILLMTMNPAHGLRGAVRPFLAVHYDDYRELALDKGTGLADHYARWMALSDDQRRFPDGLHPLDEIATEVIVAPTARLIAAAYGVDCT